VPGGKVGLGVLFGSAAAVIASETVEKVGDIAGLLGG
jgi:hypothetical protein